MKKQTALSCVLASSAGLVALVLPSAAHAGDVYVGLSGGVSLPSDSNNSGEFTEDVDDTDDFDEIEAETPLGWTTEFDNGFALNGQIGYAFDSGFRIEAELSYSQNKVDTHSGLFVGDDILDDTDVAVLTRDEIDDDNLTVGETLADGQGDVSRFGMFANVFYDIQTGTGFKPYVGAGVGFETVVVEYVPSEVEIADGEDTVFSYQLMAGATIEVAEKVEVFGQYTYRAGFDDANVDLDLLPATLGIESQQSLITAGVRVKL